VELGTIEEGLATGHRYLEIATTACSSPSYWTYEM